jgi:hypothetical protein
LLDFWEDFLIRTPSTKTRPNPFATPTPTNMRPYRYPPSSTPQP